MTSDVRKLLKTCSTCCEEFATVRELIVHEMQHGKSSKDIKDDQSKSSSASTTNKLMTLRKSWTSFYSNAPIIKDESTGDKKFLCEYCFGSFKKLPGHLQSCHFVNSGSPLYYCWTCCGSSLHGSLNRTYYRTSIDFHEHLRTQHGIDGSISSTSNDNRSSSRELLASSSSSTSNNDIKHSTEVTRQEILDRLSAESELRESDISGTFLCKYCFGPFVHLNAMSKHIEKYHRGTNDHIYYFCFRCYLEEGRMVDSCFENESELRTHLIERHHLTTKLIDKHTDSWMTKLNRSDLPKSIRTRDWSFKPWKGENALQSSVVSSKKRRLDSNDGSELRSVKQEPIDEMVSSNGASPDSSGVVVKEEPGTNSMPELRSVKEEPLDETEIVIVQHATVNSDQTGHNLELRPVKEEETSSAFFVEVKTEPE